MIARAGPTYSGRVDRDAAQRRDFPLDRRGYDPAAVDAHLRAVADEMDALRSRPPARLSAGTSERVRVIPEASAADHVARGAGGGRLAARMDELERELATARRAVREWRPPARGLAWLHEQFGAAPEETRRGRGEAGGEAAGRDEREARATAAAAPARPRPTSRSAVTTRRPRPHPATALPGPATRRRRG